MMDHASDHVVTAVEQQASAQTPLPSGAALPPTNGIQMKYLENMIKEAHEETL